MHDRAGKHHQVPDGMGVFFAFPNVKENAESVKQAAEDEKQRADGADCGKQLPGNENDCPAHDQIKRNRPQFGAAAGSDDFQNRADQRQTPDDGKNRPADRPAHVDQQKGRVAAGDQIVDGDVVKFFQNFFHKILIRTDTSSTTGNS